ncbi:MAG TPA: response regulator [Pyrinomonadaceae bacterium]|jgi:two-component system cell cycle response regulator DivK|nr:response regulator [Pyrinomonadaceae bacterium]
MKTRNASPLIMVADRDELERAQLKAVLKLKGFRVLEAASGPQAFELATEHRPDLLLLDLQLPLLRGAEAISQIRREPCLRRTPIITVSNHANGNRNLPLDPLTVHASRPIEFTRLDLYLAQFLPKARSFAA